MSDGLFTAEDLQRSVELLEALAQDRSLFVTMDHDIRVRLIVAAGRVSRPTRDEQRRVAKVFRKKARADVRAHDRELTAQTEIRAARRAEVYVPPPQLVGPPGDVQPRELIEPRQCYVCKEPYRKLHFFYDSMCAACAELNYAKRFQTASLVGRTALITGARIKIGYQAALMMLRAGARVLVTTRFPRDAAARFAREEDFGEWKERLQVFGLDLRHAPSVEMFARYVTQAESRLDILINNAAQTVRRPAAFYAPLLDAELRSFAEVPAAVRPLLEAHEACKSAIASSPAQALAADTGGVLAWRGGEGPGVGIRSSALLSQVPCADHDPTHDRQLFPAGRTDADLQQVDLRAINSWRLALADIPSPEMLEVQLVNAVAPFILCSKLKPLMMRDRSDEKHIVNVSAMEGQFSRHTKTDKHPHTNMAKAALNMMTLTSAPDYAASGIFMNAVDTGWVTDEDPAALSLRKQENHDFQPPLDIVDGAARICDPFFSGLLTGKHVWGKFLKDYGEAKW